MGVTIKDIAKLAGVNHSTVSRSLNNKPGVSEETREKIKKIAIEMGFEFNSNARGLSSSNKTETIGIIFPESFNEVIAGSFLNEMMKRVQYNIEKYNYDTIIEFLKNRFNKKSNIRRIIDRKKIDGLIISAPLITHADYEYIQKHKIPHVFLHNRPQYFDLESLVVYCDHVKGGMEAVEYLVKSGHKNIIMVQCKEMILEFKERSEGFYKALKNNNINLDKNLILNCDLSFNEGYNVIMDNQDILKKGTAIFFHSDIIALGGIKALKELNYKIPKDFSIMGYDDLELGTYYHPYLTTIKQPVNEMTELAVKKLINLIENKKVTQNEKIKIEPQFIERESVKKIKKL